MGKIETTSEEEESPSILSEKNNNKRLLLILWEKKKRRREQIRHRLLEKRREQKQHERRMTRLWKERAAFWGFSPGKGSNKLNWSSISAAAIIRRRDFERHYFYASKKKRMARIEEIADPTTEAAPTYKRRFADLFQVFALLIVLYRIRSSGSVFRVRLSHNLLTTNNSCKKRFF